MLRLPKIKCVRVQNAASKLNDELSVRDGTASACIYEYQTPGVCFAGNSTSSPNLYSLRQVKPGNRNNLNLNVTSSKHLNVPDCEFQSSNWGLNKDGILRL